MNRFVKYVRWPETLEAALLATSRLNDDVQARLFDLDHLGSTYPESMILRSSTEWEAASRTRPLPGRSGKADNILVKKGGRSRRILEIV